MEDCVHQLIAVAHVAPPMAEVPPPRVGAQVRGLRELHAKDRRERAEHVANEPLPSCAAVETTLAVAYRQEDVVPLVWWSLLPRLYASHQRMHLHEERHAPYA